MFQKKKTQNNKTETYKFFLYFYKIFIKFIFFYKKKQKYVSKKEN